MQTYAEVLFVWWLWCVTISLSPPTYKPTPNTPQIARQVGGEWLAGWIVLSAALSNVGLYLVRPKSHSKAAQAYSA